MSFPAVDRLAYGFTLNTYGDSVPYRPRDWLGGGRRWILNVAERSLIRAYIIAQQHSSSHGQIKLLSLHATMTAHCGRTLVTVHLKEII
jgi:hypothetical protein